MSKKINFDFSEQDYRNIVRQYPFLYPRSMWTLERIANYKYDWCLGVDELPKGWIVLFLLYCKHLKEELTKCKYLDKFIFTQIKEKYGSMRLYNNGYPSESRISELGYIFEHLSTYVCEDCGKVARYETIGWITQLCESCYKESYPTPYLEDKNKNKLRRKNYYVIIDGWSNGEYYKKRYDCRLYWEEYLKCNKMGKDELFRYLGIIGCESNSEEHFYE